MMPGGGLGKSLYFPQQLLHVQNPACKSSLVESQDPCVLFANVLCEGSSTKDSKSEKEQQPDCRYSLKLTYESSGPQPIILGQPQHNSVKDGTFNYYYLTLKEKDIVDNQQIVAVLSSMKGNADLYMNYIDTPQRNNPEEWDLPTQKEYMYKSTNTGMKQDMIKIDANKDQNLHDCFQRFNNKFGNEAECAVVFGIYSPAQTTENIKDINRTNIT